MSRTTKLALLCAVTTALLTTQNAAATTFEVGPNQDYTSLSQVAELLQPGDVVEVLGDNTYSGGVAFRNAGSASQPITIRGVRQNGKRPVITGGYNTIEANGNHYVFEGLELTAGSFRCFYHHADDIVLRDAVVRDCPAHGVLGGDFDSGSLLMEYVEVYGCGNGTQEHQIYMATDESAYPGSVFRMQHCYVHDGNGGNNVKSRAERNEIYYNWIEGAMYHEVELIGPDGQSPALAREDSDVVGNVLIKTGSTFVVRFGGDGTGETDGRYRFINNTVITRPGGSAVFRLFDGLESLSVHNNVFFGDGGVNMVRDVEVSWAGGSARISGSNNWVEAGSSNVPSSWTGTVTGNDPGFLDFDGMDLRPHETSPLVDAGAAATPDPSGSPFPNPLPVPLYMPPLHTLQVTGSALRRPVNGPIDIGAYELGGAGEGGGGAGGSGEGGSGEGASGQGGSGQAGSGASGGMSGTGGSSPSSGAGGDMSGSGGPGSGTGAGNGSSDGDGEDDTGCSLGSTNHPGDAGLGLAALGTLAFAVSRRRRRTS